MPLNFTAIDFETANRYPASACAVGLVRVRDGKIVDGYSQIFEPPKPYEWFENGNIAIHGIHPSDVADGPKYEAILASMLDFIGEDVLVAHNAPFDMGVLRASAEALNFELPNINYGCSLEISRKTYHLESYRLNSVAYAIGHEEFKHHDALADADACARIIIHAADRHGVDSFEELLQFLGKKLKPLNV